MSAWRRWFKYGKAKLDDTVDGLNRSLDRKEEDLDAAQKGKPWLQEDTAAPSYDDTKARIEEVTKDVPKGPASSGDPTFDLATQQREADARLAEIRRSLDVDDAPPAE